MQGKFYPYHWGVVIPMLAHGAAQGLRQLPERARSAIPLAICAVLYLFPVPWVSNNAENLRTRTVAFWNYVSGDIDRRTYLSPFIGLYYTYEQQEFIGTYIRDRSRSGDLLHVRGFESAIYDVAGLRSPSRFFAEFPLVDPKISYRRDEWKALHEKLLWETLPRWFITRKSMIQTDYPLLINAGYHEVLSVGRFVLFKHGDE